MGWRSFLSLTFFICWLLNTLPWKTLCQRSTPSPDISVTFLQVPSPLSNLNTAEFTYKVAGGGGETRSPCSICCLNCVLDGQITNQCGKKITSFQGLQDGDHTFEVCAKESQGRMGCATYNWTIDTVAPTAHIRTSTSFTIAQNVTTYISFSEPCSPGGGFQCSSVNNCDLLVYGAGQVIPQSLTTLVPNQKYSVLISLSSKVDYGNVTLAMNKAVCTDAAGNKFRRVEKSKSIVHFDRRSVSVSMKVNVPVKQIEINGQTQTVQATNDRNDLKVYLEFSQPILNMSGNIQKFLNVSNASLQPIPGEGDGNRRFGFHIVNVSSSEVVTVQLNSSMIVARQGTPISPVAPAAFVVDYTRPVVSLSTSSDMITRKTSIEVNIEFTKPVFGLNFTHINVSGGHLKSFEERKDKVFYVVNIEALGDDDVIHISIPENVTSDAAGNGNLPSNILPVRYYNPASALPAVASACVTGSFLATGLAAGLLTVSTSTLQSAGAIAGPSLASEPTRNIFRTASYIQVFALSRMVGVTPPAEFYEFTTYLKWSIPYLNLPWEKGNNDDGDSSVSTKRTGLEKGEYRQARSVNGAPPALPSAQLGSLLQRSNQKPKAGYVPSPQESNGWMDFERCMFWLAIIGGGLTLLQSFMLLVLKLRNGFDRRRHVGALVFPRFQIFLLILAIPSICKASGSIIKGGTGSGKAVGGLLLGLASLLQLSVFAFLSIGITSGKLLHYKEDHLQVNQNIRWYQKLTRVILGYRGKGQWKWKDKEDVNSMSKVARTGQSDNVNLIRYGPLFEDLRGPHNYLLSHNENNTLKQRDRVAVVSSDETQDADAPFIQKLFGTLGIYYLQIESVKRFVLGVLAGLYSHGMPSKDPTIILLCISSFQLFIIIFKKPFIRRKVLLVEIISIACQVGNFMAMLIQQDRSYSPRAEKEGSIAMIVLFLVGFSPMIANEWFALRKQTRQLGGMKMAGRGLLMFVSSNSGLLDEKDDGGDEELGEDDNAPMRPDGKERNTNSKIRSSYRTHIGPTRQQKTNARSSLAEKRIRDNGANVEKDGTKEEKDDTKLQNDGVEVEKDDTEVKDDDVQVEKDDIKEEYDAEAENDGIEDEQREDNDGTNFLEESDTDIGATTEYDDVEVESKADENVVMPLDNRERRKGSMSECPSKMKMGKTKQPRKMTRSTLTEESSMNNKESGDDDGIIEEPGEDDGVTILLDQLERQRGSKHKVNARSSLTEKRIKDNDANVENDDSKEEKDDMEIESDGMEVEKDDTEVKNDDIKVDSDGTMEEQREDDNDTTNLVEGSDTNNGAKDEYGDVHEESREDDNVNMPPNRERQEPSTSKQSKKQRKMTRSTLAKDSTTMNNGENDVDDGTKEEPREDGCATMFLDHLERQRGSKHKMNARSSLANKRIRDNGAKVKKYGSKEEVDATERKNDGIEVEKDGIEVEKDDIEVENDGIKEEKREDNDDTNLLEESDTNDGATFEYDDVEESKYDENVKKPLGRERQEGSTSKHLPN